MSEKQFEYGRMYYFILVHSNEVDMWRWEGDLTDTQYAEAGLVKETREEAEAALERVRKALKGEVWDREEVEGLLKDQRELCNDAYVMATDPDEPGWDEKLKIILNCITPFQEQEQLSPLKTEK